MKQIETHPLSGAVFHEMGRCFESFAYTERIGDIARRNPSLRRSAVQALVNQATLMHELYAARRSEFASVVIGTESVETLVTRLLDAAKPMLGGEISTAGVYGELPIQARSRVGDLLSAEPSASQPGKMQIHYAIERISPPFSTIEALLNRMSAEAALRLVSGLRKYDSQDELRKARVWFSEIDSKQHPKNELGFPTDSWFDGVRDMLANPSAHGIKVGR